MHKFTLYLASTTGNKNQTIYSNPVTIENPADLQQAAGFDHTGYYFADSYRVSENYLKNDVIIMDLDNGHSENPAEWQTVEDILQAFPDVELYLIPSRNHLKEKQEGNKTLPAREKYHIYFPLRNTLEDSEKCRQLLQSVLNEYPYFDKHLSDVGRQIFGYSNPHEARHIEGTKCIDEFGFTKSYEIATGDAWDGISEIKAGSRNNTVLAHMAFYIKRNAPTDDQIRAELNKALAACNPALPQSEQNQLLKSANQWKARMNLDKNYIPDLKQFIMTKEQEAIEKQEIIKSWDGISANALIIINTIDKYASGYAGLIKRFNGMERWPVAYEKNLISDVKAYFKVSAEIPGAEVEVRKSAVLEVLLHSALYLRFEDDLLTVLPDGSVKVNSLLDQGVNEYLKQNNRSALPTFREGNKFKHEKAAQAFIEKYPCIFDSLTRETFVYLTDKGRYSRDINQIDRLIIKDFMSESTNATRREMMKTVMGFADEREGTEDNRFIGFKNGVLDIITGDFMPLSADYFLLNIMPHNYNPQAKPVPAVDRAFTQWAAGNESVRNLMIEAIGYSMYRGAELKSVFFLTGDKNNGKSLYLDWLGHILGTDNYSSVPLDNLEERFAIAPMYGKLANICTENGSDYITKTKILKQITDNSPLNFEFKGQDSFSALNTATCLFSFNELPTFKDTTSAVKDRIVPIPFLTTFTSNPQEVDESKNILPEDHTLKAELFSESAIEYVISLAVAGLKTALDRGRFIIPEAAKDALEEIDRENNSATAFYNDMLDDRGKEYFFTTSTNEMYLAYRSYCEDNGYMHPFANRGRGCFSKKIEVLAGARGKEKQREGNKTYYFLTH